MQKTTFQREKEWLTSCIQTTHKLHTVTHHVHQKHTPPKKWKWRHLHHVDEPLASLSSKRFVFFAFNIRRKWVIEIGNGLQNLRRQARAFRMCGRRAGRGTWRGVRVCGIVRMCVARVIVWRGSMRSGVRRGECACQIRNGDREWLRWVEHTTEPPLRATGLEKRNARKKTHDNLRDISTTIHHKVCLKIKCQLSQGHEKNVRCS